MPSILQGWVVVLRHEGRCKALPADASVIDLLTPEEQQGLPSKCGVWETEEEADKVVVGLPEDIRPLAEVLPIGITVLKRKPRKQEKRGKR